VGLGRQACDDPGLGDKGVLLAGTADRAILYRVHPDGRAEALHDFEANEIRAIARVADATYLAVNAFERPSDAQAAPVPGAQPGKGTKVSPGRLRLRLPGLSREPTKSRHMRRSIAWTMTAASSRYSPLPMAISRLCWSAGAASSTPPRELRERSIASHLTERRPWLSTYPSGRPWRWCPRPKAFWWAPAMSVPSFACAPRPPAKLRISPRCLTPTALRDGVFCVGPDRPTWFSRPARATRPSRQELERVDQIGIGQPPRPGRQGKAAGTQARYLQYRVGLPAPSSALREVLAYYVPHNQRARVTEVYLADAASAPVASGAGGAAGSLAIPAAGTRSHSSVLKLRWKVEIPTTTNSSIDSGFGRNVSRCGGLWRA